MRQTRTPERIIDLPISGSAVELKVWVCQFQCDRCEVAFTPEVLERATELIRSSDVANVAKFYGLQGQTLVLRSHGTTRHREQGAAQADLTHWDRRTL